MGAATTSPTSMARSLMAKSDADAALGATVQRLRHERGITQEGLAFSSDVTVSALSRIERGLSSPIWATIIKIAAALDLSPCEMIATVEHTTGPNGLGTFPEVTLFPVSVR
jgi:transcriptional regulator with XRE-family HTH domain